MAIDRIGSNAHVRAMMVQMQRAESQLHLSQRQIASGYVSDTYTGYGSQTAALEAARSAAARAEAHMSIAEQAASRIDLQDTQLVQLGNLVDEVRQELTKALAQGDAQTLMAQLEDMFRQAIQILNAKDGSGYIYGGENDQTPPVTVTSLADLAALPSVADAFANGTLERNARIGENRTIQVGLLASELGTQLFTLMRDIKQFNDGASGPFGAQLTPAQDSFLSNAMPQVIDAHKQVNAIAAANGDRYRVIESAIEELRAATTVYKTFVADIQDVDMGEALARFQQNQIALQAAYQMSSTIGELSLLNYLR